MAPDDQISKLPTAKAIRSFQITFPSAALALEAVSRHGRWKDSSKGAFVGLARGGHGFVYFLPDQSYPPDLSKLKSRVHNDIAKLKRVRAEHSEACCHYEILLSPSQGMVEYRLGFGVVFGGPASVEEVRGAFRRYGLIDVSQDPQRTDRFEVPLSSATS